MKQNTRHVVFTALTVAMTTVFTLISIALPGGGYYNFGDLAIFISAVILGPVSGLISGAIGAALGDVILGYFAYVPFTMIVKALEGLIAGLIAKAAVKFCKNFQRNQTFEAFFTALGCLLGGITMAGGYFLAEGLLLAEGKWSGGIINLPWNLLQGTISALLAVLMLYALRLKQPLTKVYADNSAAKDHVDKKDNDKTQEATENRQNENDENNKENI